MTASRNFPWTKPSMAFVHLIDRRQRRGFPGSMARASCAGFPWTKGVTRKSRETLSARLSRWPNFPALPDEPACCEVGSDPLGARKSVAVVDAATPAPLPGSPKRELREYASLHRKPHHIPSARASGFQERDRQTRQTGNQLPGIEGSLAKLGPGICEVRPNETDDRARPPYKDAASTRPPDLPAGSRRPGGAFEGSLSLPL
jgi:hypothetical protein